MFIRNQYLTVEPSAGVDVASAARDFVDLTITFTVVLWPDDMTLGGGYHERVGLLGLPDYVHPVTIKGNPPDTKITLWLDDAVEPQQGDFKELYREHTFRIPRHSQGPFTTVRCRGYIEITPSIKMDDYRVTEEIVLPAEHTLSSAIRAAPKRIRDISRHIRNMLGP